MVMHVQSNSCDKFDLTTPSLLFISLGATIDRTINNGTSPYVFKINGIVYHSIGTLLPQQGARPNFAQLYIHDTKNEEQNRLNLFENDDNSHVQ
jgi:hypothetical protein